MAHREQTEFVNRVRLKYPNRFRNCSVLDVGSQDINGNNRFFFTDCIYVGIDIGPGKNVDVICKAKDFKPSSKFDLIISTECFEHDPDYIESIKNIYSLIKDNGMFVFTCASDGRPEHGTRKTMTAWANPIGADINGDYYKNINENNIRAIFNPIESYFKEYYFEYNRFSCDLYFYGIK